MTKDQCYKLAHAVAKAAGFSNFTALHRAVIAKGALESAGGDVAKAHALTMAHRIAQDCIWAAEAKGDDRARWLRVAHLAAFQGWAAGRTLQAVAS